MDNLQDNTKKDQECNHENEYLMHKNHEIYCKKCGLTYVLDENYHKESLNES